MRRDAGLHRRLGGGETRGRKWARHTCARERAGAKLRAANARRRALPTAQTPGCRRRRDFTIPRSRRIPAASASSPTSRARASHQIVSDALNILCNLEHRGAVGADPRAGDGAGILVQIPHAFFAQGRRDRLPAAEARRLRDRRAVHAARNGLAQGDPEHHRRTDQGRRPDAARLARRADRQFLARRNRQADRALPHAGVHRPQRHGEDRGRVRAPALHPAQVDLAGDLSAPRPRPGRLLPGLACRAAP